MVKPLLASSSPSSPAYALTAIALLLGCGGRTELGGPAGGSGGVVAGLGGGSTGGAGAEESGGSLGGSAGGGGGARASCEPSPCQNGGQCLEHRGHAICDCRPGFFGDRCELGTTAIAVGRNHTCLLRTDGTLACWGNGEEGQASPPDGTFEAVAAGAGHS